MWLYYENLKACRTNKKTCLNTTNKTQRALTTDPKPNWLNLKCFLLNLAKLYKACQALQTATQVINLVDLVKERKAVNGGKLSVFFSFYLNKSAY